MSDTTYLLLASGAWAYLCSFQDVCTKHEVGWQVRADMPGALVTSALQRALLAQRLTPGLVVYSDQDGQCVGNAYKVLLLHGAKAQLSHGRRGECYDNALPDTPSTTQAESYWSHRKTEVLKARDWPVFSDLANPRPASPSILITVIMTVATPALVTKNLIRFINDNLTISPHSLLPD